MNLKQIQAMFYYDPKLKQRSRELRNRSTLSEVLLWNQLKHRKMLGYSFLRQRPIHKYIVDFYCSKLKLVIEIVGDSHRNKFHSDQTREWDLKNLGLHLLRFHDRDVKRDMRNVLRCIQSWIEQRLKESDRGHPPTPPSKGESVGPITPSFMTRWEQIEKIFQAALELEESQRMAFLKEVCGGDEELRREVESLLRFDRPGDRFIEEPPWRWQPRWWRKSLSRS